MKNKKTIFLVAFISLISGIFVYQQVLSKREAVEDPSVCSAFSPQMKNALTLGENLPIIISNSAKLNSLTLTLDGLELFNLKDPGSEVKRTVETSKLPIGRHALRLHAVSADGNTLVEDKIITVYPKDPPKNWTLSVVKRLPHLSSSFTEGLVFSEGKLYEGTGDLNQKGTTFVGEIDLESGSVLRSKSQPAPTFGEGIAIVGNLLYQLTYRENKCFVYDKNSLNLLKTFTYTGEGWGLTFDGKHLIMTDGTSKISFRDTSTFKEIKTIYAFTEKEEIPLLNELEFIDGLIYSNVFQTNNVAVIDPNTGAVVALINAQGLAAEIGPVGNEAVLNGIAYNPLNKKLYMTGKYWPTLFEISLQKN
jgi:glutamine cyclotransferase